jgi:hypothetical protein
MEYIYFVGQKNKPARPNYLIMQPRLFRASEPMRGTNVSTIFNSIKSTRSKKGKIPEELWKLVVPLMDQYNRNEISSALKLNYTQLKERI